MEKPLNNDSREKILEVASQIFAQKGYKETTVREICKAAGTYQLSINYYFGSKENLFMEVIHKTYNDTKESVVQERTKDECPEKQLEEIIRARVFSVFSDDKSGIFFKLIAREMSTNYEMVSKTCFQRYLPYFEFVKDVFRKLSNNTFDEFELNYCSYLLMTHISTFSVHKKAVEVVFGTDKPTEKDLEKFVQQVKTFMLAGVKQIKQDKEVNNGITST